ncbi:MAG TPA: hypothetical protein H9761_16135 [Candidatus Eisenbergiella merdavium]|uniref:Lipoprotein n=1 Tax=Candidatus Eisenbergiella merdavium TaxID=2838551 RepID=A0A9D2NJ50_9FIRM|nr:hypothetical protein [Candidatus Eisenbergiella merdavium]
MKRLNRIPALLILMMLVCTAACGRKEQNADDMANNMTETSQVADETNTDAVFPENETGETDGINGSNLGTTGEPATETMDETAGGNSTANESSGIIDETGNVIGDEDNAAGRTDNAAGNAASDAGNAVENAADDAGNAVKDVIDGAGDVVRDAADGVAEGVKDMTGTK